MREYNELGPRSVFISSRVAKLVEERGARCRSEDWRTRRELGVDCRLGRRVRARSIWDRWLTWKCESRPSTSVSVYLPTPWPALQMS